MLEAETIPCLFNAFPSYALEIEEWGLAELPLIECYMPFIGN